MKFERFTANPKHETNDCAIRSLANAFGQDWQTTMKEVCDVAVDLYLMPNNEAVVIEYLKRKNENIKVKFVPSFDPITVGQFAEENPEGRYFIAVVGHGLSMIDGTVYDLVNPEYDNIDYYARIDV